MISHIVTKYLLAIASFIRFEPQGQTPSDKIMFLSPGIMFSLFFCNKLAVFVNMSIQ